MAYVYNPIYTHFKGEDITRVERVERLVVETIVKSKRQDEDRSWSKTFELKHSSSVAQLGRILAQKRGLDPELGAAILARELQIPCVVGTEYATKVLKTGERIHVDTTKGTVQKL